MNPTAVAEHPREMPIFGASPAMRRVIDDLSRAAGMTSNVIISGEPGTGREIVAREIHRLTDSSDRPFVRVVYGGEPSDTFEDTFFGCASGRQGDRQERRALERIGRGGALHSALGGTLFFENLPKIPASAQARLARLLHEGAATVQHSRTTVKFNIRIIAAVEHGYDQTVRDGRIHEELFPLIAGLRIDLPPLRRRTEDIPALATYLLGETCRRAGLPSKQLTSAAQQLLSALPWHGNGVELQRLLAELIDRTRTEIIDLTDVLATVQIDARAKPYAKGGTLREARARFEREYIVAVMAQHHGRIPEAAKTLGVQRPNLYRKLRRLNVPKNLRRNGTDG